MAKLFEIYFGPVEIGHAKYARPLLIVDAPSGKHPAAVLLISTKIDTFYNANEDFIIEADDPDFASTGLKERSFISCRYQFELPSNSAPIGILAGCLLKRFRKHYGI